MRLVHQGISFSRFTASVLLQILLGLTAFTVAQASTDLAWVPFDRNQFDGNVALDPNGDVQLFWKVGNMTSKFGIASRSSGYLALGFSETGAMTGADMAVGYKDRDGNFVFENRHAMGFVTPQVSPDQKNNMRFQEGHQANGVTSFIFEKQNKADCLETQADVATDAWQWFIYAFSNENTFAQHAPGNNGKMYVKLGAGETVSTNDVRNIDGAKNFTIVQPELTIPTAETTYCYSLHKMPAGKKNYLLGERPNNSSGLLHHLVLYACYGLPDGYMDMLDKEANCDYQTFSNPCTGFVTEWAPGMSGRTFEPGYGKPFGTDHYEYVMLETHYNNPKGIEGTKDTASYTFLYTENPVDTEVGTLTLGDLQVEGWFLEPGKQLVAHSTVCTPECTDHWPSDGITAVSVFHHMHYRGRNTRVQIIRDGKELAPLSTLRDFEYGYQFLKNLDSVKLLPGDKLITTCEYDTSNDTEPVPGGLPSKAEMCFAWVDYYPANNILACTQVNLGDSPDNMINGTAALCMESSAETPDIYESTFLTAPFQNLSASGNTCSAGNTTSRPDSQSNQAAVLNTCPESNVCFSLNVPQQSASSGSGDIYFQLSAPTTYSWVALAQGTTMSNANMFLMYSSADGGNVTLSPRNTSEHIMPTYNNAADVTLLDGSGIFNGRMTANVRCSNCNSWGTGTMNLQGGNSNWLYAHSQGPPINSDDMNAPISKHNGEGSFQWDVSRATGGSGTNPFANAVTTNTTSGVDGKNSWERLSTKTQMRFIQAHGALASIAFIAILPFGAILVRLTSFRGLIWTHASLQVFGYAVFIAAAGLGIFIANGSSFLHEPHAIIGMVLVASLFFMPFVGTIHHRLYKKVQKRTLWSYAHIFTGRAIVTLGMINGGLGLRLADASRPYIIVYSVFAGLMGIAYICAISFGEHKRSKKSSQDVAASSQTHHESKRLDRDDSGSDTPQETTN